MFMKQYPHQRHAKGACQTKENERKPSNSNCILATEPKTTQNVQNKIEFSWRALRGCGSFCPVMIHFMQHTHIYMHVIVF